MKPLIMLLLAVIPLGSIQQELSVTVYLIGDSTIAQKLETRRPETGWGDGNAGGGAEYHSTSTVDRRA